MGGGGVSVSPSFLAKRSKSFFPSSREVEVEDFHFFFLGRRLIVRVGSPGVSLLAGASSLTLLLTLAH